MNRISCNFCGQNNDEFLFHACDINYKTTDEIFSIVRCRSCGLVYINPRPAEKQFSLFYPDTYRPYSLSTSDVDKEYEEPRNPSRYVLDIGSGSGDFLAKLHKKDKTLALYGVDFDKRAVEAGKLRGFQIFYGSIFEANYPAEKFDEAHMSHFLEHVVNPLETLKETNRILKHGGKLVITIPNFASLSRMIFGKYWYHLDAPRHLYHFTPSTLKALLEKAGFKNIKVEFFPSPKYFLQSWAFWRYGGKKKFPKLAWRFFVIPAKLISLLKLSSTMKVSAEK